MAAPAPVKTVRALDPMAARRMWNRWARADAPWLHGEVARRMADRLPVIRMTPTSVIEWWGHVGASDEVLRAAYPKARRWRVEPIPALRDRSAGEQRTRWWRASRWLVPDTVVCSEDEVPAGAAQLLWSNMALQSVADPPQTIAQWRRALAVDGFLMFSTLGPDTVRELRRLYRDAGWGPPNAAFVDMHDLGDMLVQAGFADPVMDQEQITLTWSTPEACLAELRTLGANADPARHAGLRTPRWRDRLHAALQERADAHGRIALTFEVAYGHAFNPPPRVALAAQTEVSLDEMRNMVRSRRRPTS